MKRHVLSPGVWCVAGPLRHAGWLGDRAAGHRDGLVAYGLRRRSPDRGLDFFGRARGVATADLNNDGWLHVIVKDVDGPPRVWRGLCGEATWLRPLVAHFGLGEARVEVAWPDGGVPVIEDVAGGRQIEVTR